MVSAYVVIGLLILLDVITGIIKAGYEKNIQSTILRKGLYHKISEVLAILLTSLIQYGSQYINFPIHFPVTLCVMGYIGLMEITSILENICKINPDMFKIFQRYIKNNKSDGDEE